MIFLNEGSHSLWQEESDPPFLPALSSHQTADVCVIGAGIAGLTAAYELLREGRSVVVLDRQGIGEGQTGLTSAHLSSALDEGYTELTRLFGHDGARLAADSHSSAIDEIERIVSEEGIECDFRRVDGYLFSGRSGAATGSREELEEELEAATGAGLEGLEIVGETPSPFNLGTALRFPRQAQFHPLRYLIGLAQVVRRRGGKIFLHTEAQSVEGGKPARVTTSKGFQVVSGSVIVAANVPFNDRITMHTKMAPYRSYLIALPLKTQPPPALYWDTASPYHYLRFVRSRRGEPLLLLGGEDHRTGQGNENERFAALREWAEKRIGIKGPVAWQWSGQVLEPHDGLAYIGRNPGDEKNVYIATGDSGHGLTHGTIAGMLLRDLILERTNPWAPLYEPSRVSLRSLDTYIKEAYSSTAPYGDWLSPGDVSSLQEIPPGEGAVIREGLQKIAAFKDQLGRMHLCSAVCPHLNGIVRWNSAEKTWDCPCHGSRFDHTGKVLNGPAATGLREIVDTSIQEGESVSA